MLGAFFAWLAAFGGDATAETIALHPIGQPTPNNEPAASQPVAGFFSLLSWYEIVMMVAAVGLSAAFFGRGWYRISALPRYQEAIRPLLGFMGFAALLIVPVFIGLVVVVMMGIDLEAIESMTAPEKLRLEGITRGAMLVAAIGVVALIAALARLEGGHSRWMPPPLAQPLTNGRAAMIGILGWLGSWPVVTTASALTVITLFLFSGRTPDRIAHDTLRLFAEARGSVWLPVNILVVIVVAPIVEELQYRYFLQRAFRSMRMRPWIAITLTSLPFSLMHLSIAEPHALVPLFVLSLALGWSYERSGRVITPMILHAGFNLANVMIFLIAMGSDGSGLSG